MGLDAGINRQDGNEVIYWRKANQIHQWFVENIQNGVDDCGKYEVTVEQLSELRDLCQQVIVDPKLAEELLPTQSGFFFGSTEYDEWYFEDVLRTRDCLSDLLEQCDDNEIFVYWSSW